MNAVAGPDKPNYTLIPPWPLNAIAWAFTSGAKKYAPEDWRKLPKGNRLAAAMRHIESYRSGETIDREDHIHHLGMAAADLLMEMENAKNGR